MKNARYLLAALIVPVLFSSAASADPADNPYSNPNTRVDPDGVPLANRETQQHQLTPEEISALHRQQQRAAADKDWLVRNYEQQVRSHSASGSSESDSSSYYYQLSTNKELARLAGVPEIDDNAVSGIAPTPLSTRPAALRNPSSASPSAAGNLLFKPLITPLSSPEAAGLHDFYSSLLPSPITPALSSDSAPVPAPIRSDEPSDPADIETPGMIAAEKDPLAQPDQTDLGLDVLPGESIAEAKKHQENENRLELALPMDASQLHREQSAELTPAKATTSNLPPIVNAPTKPVPVVDPNAPMPVTKIPQITPVRGSIAKPFDILDR
jgi:hypothetical protein